jgi:hypothetical protein
MEVFLLIVAVCIFVVLYQRGAKQRAESHAAQPPTILEQVLQKCPEGQIRQNSL